MDVLHMLVDVVTFVVFLVAVGVLASWMHGQLGGITECVNASDFSALSLSPYYYTIPSWNFLDNATESSTVLAAEREAKYVGELDPDACRQEDITQTAAYVRCAACAACSA